MVFEAGLNFKASGSIKKKTIQSLRIFFTPGSKTNATNDDLIPEYKNSLGVFNFLEKPKLKFAEYKPYAKEYKCLNGDIINLNNLPNIRQVKVDKDFDYVLNPASNLEIKSIEAAIQVKYDEKLHAKVKDFKDKNLFNLVAKPVEFGPPYTYPSGIVDRYKQSNFIIEQWPEDFPDDAEMISLRSRYVPLSCFKDQSLFHYVNSGDIREPEYYCKLKVKLERKDNEGQNVLIVRTFPFEMNKQKGDDLEYRFKETLNSGCPPEFYPTKLSHNNKPGPVMPAPFREIPEDKHLKGQINQDVKAKENIFVYDQATISSGITLRAGNEIKIFGQNSIPSGVKIEIGPPLPSCEDPDDQYQATPQELATFCQNGGAYEKRTRMKKSPIESSPKAKMGISGNLKASLTPNPVNNETHITVELPKSTNVEVDIKDLSGKTVKHRIVNKTFDKGLHKISLNTTNFRSGFYLVTIQSRFGRKTLKFVKE